MKQPGEKWIKRSPSFFDEVRKSKNVSVETKADSSVIKVNGTMRLGQLTQLMPLTSLVSDGHGAFVRTPVDFLLNQQIAAYMAMAHFNDRKSAVVPGLSERLKSCDYFFTMEIFDTRYEILYASRNFFAVSSRTHSLATPRPTCVVGAYRYAVSKPLAVLGGTYQIPQISPSSTSSDLDDKFDAPLFARTIPTNAGDSKATIAYLQSLGVTHFAIVFIRDSFGAAFHSDLIAAASTAQIAVLSSPFEDSDEDTMRSAVQLVADSEYRYVLAIATPKSWKILLKTGYELGIAGNSDHLWLFSEGMLFIDLTVDPQREPELAAALHGTGVIMLDVPVNKNLVNALEQFRADTQIQGHFLDTQYDPTIFDTYDLSRTSESTPGLYEHTIYDAVIAFGIAACETEEDFFSGHELYDQIKNTTFQGASGNVSFDPLTGTRNSESVIYLVNNLVKNEQLSTAESIQFDVFPAARVEAGTVFVLKPFVYAGKSVLAPQSLPAYAMEMNLIPLGLQIFGWLLAALVLSISSGFIYWTIKHRAKAMIRASQPLFLCQLCVGTIIMASTIIPFSLQEPVEGLNASCMSIPWLLTTGFVTSFSALLAKQWRINRIFHKSSEMVRTEIKAKDAMWMCGLLLAINYVVLVAWTVVAPLQWTRVLVDNFDSFGRSVESYGTCWQRTKGSSEFAFMLILFFINMVVVCFANYQSYLARNIPSDFNESLHITLSMASLLETTLLGIPIVFLVSESPPAAFLVASLLITALCLAIMLPLFLPKVLHKTKGIDETELREHWRKQRRRSSLGSVVAMGSSSRQRGESQQNLDLDSFAFNHSAPDLGTSVAEIRANIARRQSLQ